jgi:hypothetical protein
LAQRDLFFFNVVDLCGASREVVIVGCKKSAIDSLHTTGLRIFAPRLDGKPQGAPVVAAVDGGVGQPLFGKWVEFAASCETVAVR